MPSSNPQHQHYLTAANSFDPSYPHPQHQHNHHHPQQLQEQPSRSASAPLPPGHLHFNPAIKTAGNNSSVSHRQSGDNDVPSTSVGASVASSVSMTHAGTHPSQRNGNISRNRGNRNHSDNGNENSSETQTVRPPSLPGHQDVGQAYLQMLQPHQQSSANTTSTAFPSSSKQQRSFPPNTSNSNKATHSRSKPRAGPKVVPMYLKVLYCLSSRAPHSPSRNHTAINDLIERTGEGGEEERGNRDIGPTSLGTTFNNDPNLFRRRSNDGPSSSSSSSASVRKDFRNKTTTRNNNNPTTTTTRHAPNVGGGREFNYFAKTSYKVDVTPCGSSVNSFGERGRKRGRGKERNRGIGKENGRKGDEKDNERKRDYEGKGKGRMIEDVEDDYACSDDNPGLGRRNNLKRKMKNKKGERWGRVKLKRCVAAVCFSRPDLITHSQSLDYSLYVLDPKESFQSSLSRSSSTSANDRSYHNHHGNNHHTRNHNSYLSPDPDGYSYSHLSSHRLFDNGHQQRMPQLFEGKGMLTWALEEPGEGLVEVTGRIVGAGGFGIDGDDEEEDEEDGDEGEMKSMREASSSSLAGELDSSGVDEEDPQANKDDDEDYFYEDAENPPTLEVCIQFVESAKLSQSDFLQRIFNFANASGSGTHISKGTPAFGSSSSTIAMMGNGKAKETGIAVMNPFAGGIGDPGGIDMTTGTGMSFDPGINIDTSSMTRGLGRRLAGLNGVGNGGDMTSSFRDATCFFDQERPDDGKFGSRNENGGSVSQAGDLTPTGPTPRGTRGSMTHDNNNKYSGPHRYNPHSRDHQGNVEPNGHNHPQSRDQLNAATMADALGLLQAVVAGLAKKGDGNDNGNKDRSNAPSNSHLREGASIGREAPMVLPSISGGVGLFDGFGDESTSSGGNTPSWDAGNLFQQQDDGFQRQGSGGTRKPFQGLFDLLSSSPSRDSNGDGGSRSGTEALDLNSGGENDVGDGTNGITDDHGHAHGSNKVLPGIASRDLDKLVKQLQKSVSMQGSRGPTNQVERSESGDRPFFESPATDMEGATGAGLGVGADTSMEPSPATDTEPSHLQPSLLPIPNHLSESRRSSFSGSKRKENLSVGSRPSSPFLSSDVDQPGCTPELGGIRNSVGARMQAQINQTGRSGDPVKKRARVSETFSSVTGGGSGSGLDMIPQGSGGITPMDTDIAPPPSKKPKANNSNRPKKPLPQRTQSGSSTAGTTSSTLNSKSSRIPPARNNTMPVGGVPQKQVIEILDDEDDAVPPSSSASTLASKSQGCSQNGSQLPKHPIVHRPRSLAPSSNGVPNTSNTFTPADTSLNLPDKKRIPPNGTTAASTSRKDVTPSLKLPGTRNLNASKEQSNQIILRGSEKPPALPTKQGLSCKNCGATKSSTWYRKEGHTGRLCNSCAIYINQRKPRSKGHAASDPFPSVKPPNKSRKVNSGTGKAVGSPNGRKAPPMVPPRSPHKRVGPSPRSRVAKTSPIHRSPNRSNGTRTSSGRGNPGSSIFTASSQDAPPHATENFATKTPPSSPTGPRFADVDMVTPNKTQTADVFDDFCGMFLADPKSPTPTNPRKCSFVGDAPETPSPSKSFSTPNKSGPSKKETSFLSSLLNYSPGTALRRWMDGSSPQSPENRASGSPNPNNDLLSSLFSSWNSGSGSPGSQNPVNGLGAGLDSSVPGNEAPMDLDQVLADMGFELNNGDSGSQDMSAMLSQYATSDNAGLNIDAMDAFWKGDGRANNTRLMTGPNPASETKVENQSPATALLRPLGVDHRSQVNPTASSSHSRHGGGALGDLDFENLPPSSPPPLPANGDVYGRMGNEANASTPTNSISTSDSRPPTEGSQRLQPKGWDQETLERLSQSYRLNFSENPKESGSNLNRGVDVMGTDVNHEPKTKGMSDLFGSDDENDGDR